MTENKIKYNSYENSFYINDDERISQIIAPELIIEIINDYEKEIVKLIQKNKELKDKNSQLQETLAFRSNQLALMERLVDDLGSEEMARQMEEIWND